MAAAVFAPAALGFGNFVPEPTPTPLPEPNFVPEYIVVGSGAGGATVASRLATAGHSVLVLEEGPPYDKPFESPLGAIGSVLGLDLASASGSGLMQQADTDISRNMWAANAWEYPRAPVGNNVVPDDPAWFQILTPAPAFGVVAEYHLYFLNLGGTLPDPSVYEYAALEHTARIEGGNTAHNFQIWIRASNYSWEVWDSELWSPEHIVPIYDQLDALFLRHDEREYYGTQPVTAWDNAMFDLALGAEAGGWTPVEKGRHVADRPTEGAGPGYIAQTEYSRYDDATRVSSTDVFFTEEVLAMPHFQLITYAQVQKVNFVTGADGVPTADGVTYHYTGPASETPLEYTVHATAEVLVCGGTLASPQILMISGVGPAATLQEHGIEVVKDLPGVGQNLQNHILVPFLFTGPYGSEMYGNSRFDTEAAVFGVPYIEPVCQPFPPCTARILATWESGYAKAQGLPSDLDAQFICLFQIDNPDMVSSSSQCFVSRQSHVGSVGSLTITSGDINDLPELHVGYFEGEGGEADLDYFVDAINHIQTTMVDNQEVFSTYEPTDFSDAGLKEHVKRTAMSYWHWTGTTSMKPEPDGGVVDDELRVYGVHGLRVVDASVIPTIQNVNTQTSAYVVGWRAADLIIAGRR